MSGVCDTVGFTEMPAVLDNVLFQDTENTLA